MSGSLATGTLGGIVEDRQTREKMILSNWHVLAGSDYAVPGRASSSLAMAMDGTAQIRSPPSNGTSSTREIDAAVARLNGARGWVNDQVDIGPVTGVNAPDLGMRVTKSGRASGVTHGIIDGIEGELPRPTRACGTASILSTALSPSLDSPK